MKYLFFTSFLFLFPLFLNAQEKERIIAHGNLLYYTKDKILHAKIYSAHVPKKGQKVIVDKSFQLGQMKGTHGLAIGEVIGGSVKDLEIKVSEYTSVVEENGENRPMAEPGDELLIKWEPSPEELAIAHFDEDLVTAKTDFLHYKYEEAIALLNKLIKIDDHCLDCHYVRGRAYLALYQEEKAIKDFSKVIEFHHEVAGIEKAYQYRAEAYFNNGQDEEAIQDYDKLLTLDLKANEIIFLLKKKLEIYSDEEVSHKYDHAAAYEHACECVQKIEMIEGVNLQNQGLRNKHCGKDHPAEKPTKRTDFEVISQSEDGYTLKVKVHSKAQNCYDFAKLPYQENVKMDACGSTYTCDEGSSISEGVVKVASIEDDIITLSVLYWSNTINGDFLAKEYKKGDTFMAKW